MSILAATAYLAGLVPFASAQQPRGFFPNMNVPLPKGPFADWPPEQREPAVVVLRSRCTFLSIDLLATYKGPKEAGGQEAMALISACVAKAMPADWPERAAEEQKSTAAYDAAKHADPHAPDPAPLAEAMAKALSHPPQPGRASKDKP